MAEEEDQEAPEGSYESLTPELPDVEDTEDGGAIVRLEDASDAKAVTAFYANLAEKLDASRRSTLGLDLHTLVKSDKEARDKRDKQYEEALQKTGVTAESPGGAAFPGASRAVHPMLAKACIDFAARTVKELLPAGDVVKDYIPGKATKERVEKANRKTAYMNWQVKTQIGEFRAEFEQLLTQLPLGGSQYLYIYYDREKRRPVVQFWPIDDVLLPEAAGSFYTAERATMRERITQAEFKRRVKAKLYAADENDAAPAMAPQLSRAGEQFAKAEGKESTGENIDGLREVWRIRCNLELEEDDVTSGDIAPYIVEIDQQDNRVLSIIRNWEEKDDTQAQMDWLIDFTFLYWKGAVGIGLHHLIGSMASSATGAIRALLDSAHMNNMPTALMLAGSNMPGQTLELNPAGITKVDGGVAGDDIRKLVMAVPFNPPSVVLLQLLGMITEFGEGVVRTTFDNLAEGNKDMPVGTTLALIEQGMKVLGAIHLRLYDSLTKALAVLHRCNKMYIESQRVELETGEVMVTRADFQGPMDVVPVADPETFSDVQRFARVQMIAQRAMLIPQLYDLRKIEELILEHSKLPNAKELLIPAQKPQVMNAVNENAAMALGRPVIAHPEQDHLAHLQVLIDFGMSPMLGMNPIIAPQFWSLALPHIKEHIVYWYVDHMRDTVSAAMEGDVTKVMGHKDPETRAELDRTLASASARVVANTNGAFEKIPPVIQQAQALLAQMTPNMPMDPKLGAAQIQAQSKAEDRKSKEAIEQQKMQADAQKTQAATVTDLNKTREQLMAKQAEQQAKAQSDMEKEALKADSAERRELAKQEAEAEREASRQQSEMLRQQQQLAAQGAMNAQDNETALTIAAAEIESGEKVAVENGKGTNPGSGNGG